MPENSKNEEEILLIENASLPASLDQHIASVALGSTDNSADAGYDLFMSAVIGCDQVTLMADGDPLVIEIAVNQAEVRLDFVHCRANWGRDHNELFSDGKVSHSFQDTSEATLGGGVNLLSGGVSAEAKVSENRVIGGSKSAPEFIHSPLELIRIGDWRKKNTETKHPVQRYFGWRIEHSEGALRSGVLARLRVKKNWLDIKQVETTEDTVLSRAIRSLMSNKNEDVAKMKLFKRLVKELMFLRLQKSTADEFATLSASGLTVSQDHAMSVVVSPEIGEKISIPANLLMRFLTSKEGSETDTYNEIMLSETESRRINSKQFVPQASYTEALNAFCELAAIHREESRIDDYEALKKKYSENVAQDLSNLGVIRRRKQVPHFVNPFPGMDYIMAFESIVRAQPTIRKTIEILSENPTVTHLDLGNEINKFLNRNWKNSSKVRNGTQLKNWARFRGVATKKRQYSIPDDALPLFIEMYQQGKTNIEIAKHFNVVSDTVRRRKKMLRENGEI